MWQSGEGEYYQQFKKKLLGNRGHYWITKLAFFLQETSWQLSQGSDQVPHLGQLQVGDLL